MASHLLDDYVRHAGDHGRFTLEGHADGTNNAYDCLQHVFEMLVTNGDEASLFTLYEHADPWVQSWAASHTLQIDQARALTKLEQLEKARIPHVSTSAKYTIQAWKTGELRFLK